MIRLTLATLALAAGVAAAQDRKLPAPPAEPINRFVVPVRHADPAALAETLTKHFRGQGTASAVPGGLLVTAPPATADELTKLVAQIDVPAKTVEVEVLLAEVTTKAGEAAFDPAGDMVAKLDGLVKAGTATAQRVRLAAVEGQPATTTVGGNKPVTTAVQQGPGGARGGFPAQRSVSYTQVGTTVKLTAKAAGDAVVIDLSVQESKVKPTEPGEDAAALGNATLATQVSVPVGKPTLVQAVRTETATGGTVAVVVVTAKVAGAGVPMAGR